MKLTSTITIKKFLGSGHYGRVYEANDEALGKVAVKVLMRQDDETDAKWAARKAALIKEGNLLAQIDHRHVVRVHHVTKIGEAHANACHTHFDSGVAPTPCAADAEVPILVLRHCDGGSAEDFYRHGPQTIGEVQRLGLDITTGLVEVHGKGMLHRDIKPGNILFHGEHALISDFGLVTNDLQFGYASAQGYLDHLAPELFPSDDEDGLSSVKTDVWAFGMTVYRLLHGAQWYRSPHRSVLEAGELRDHLAWLPHVPKAWQRFVRKCLDPSPDKRYQRAEELFSALGKLPTEPAWVCRVKPVAHGMHLEWTMKRAGMKYRATLEPQSSIRSEWTYERIGRTGRRLAVKGSGGKPVAHSKALAAVKELLLAG